MAGLRKVFPLAVILLFAVYTARGQRDIAVPLDLPQLGQDGHKILMKTSEAVATAYTTAIDNWEKVSKKFGPTAETIGYFLQKRAAPDAQSEESSA